MPQTFAVADAVELAVVERSGFVESRHTGAAIVLDPDGTPIATLGDVDSPILPRSSLKPLQALACLTAGAPLEGERLALATASHSGTDRHVAVVRDILDAAGLGEDALGCPPAWPGDRPRATSSSATAAAPARIRMNCSGKHAAMLLACVVERLGRRRATWTPRIRCSCTSARSSSVSPASAPPRPRSTDAARRCSR